MYVDSFHVIYAAFHVIYAAFYVIYVIKRADIATPSPPKVASFPAGFLNHHCLSPKSPSIKYLSITQRSIL